MHSLRGKFILGKGEKPFSLSISAKTLEIQYFQLYAGNLC
jgi:hypothetical protein